MKTALACLLLVAAAQAVEWADLRPLNRMKPANKQLADEATIDSERIIGGEFATTGQFPYQVALRIDDAYFCGGSLISDKTVLTAAHCVKNFTKFDVHCGALNFTNGLEAGRVVVTSTDGQAHENYNALLINHDIALIHLPEAVSGPNIGTVRLPARSMTDKQFDGEIARVSGWGKPTDASPGISEILKFVNVLVINNTQCEAWYGNLTIHASNICTHTNNGTEATCSGDSGGPLVFYEDDGLPTEIGIVSFGVSLGCETRWPSAYTRVTSYLGWIETNSGVTIRP